MSPQKFQKVHIETFYIPSCIVFSVQAVGNNNVHLLPAVILEGKVKCERNQKDPIKYLKD